MTRYVVSWANTLVLAVMVGILLLVSALTWEGFSATRLARARSEHTYEVLSTLKDLDLAVTDAETGQRGYLLTGKDDYLEPYETAARRVTALQGKLQHLAIDNPGEQERLNALEPVVRHKLEELAQTVNLRRTVGFDAAARVLRTDIGREDMKRIEASLAAMTAEEQELLREREAQSNQRESWVGALVASGTIIAVLALLWATQILNRALKRSYQAEAEQRTIALRLRTSLDSLSQGVAVFSADRCLTNWNGCFQALLDFPKAVMRAGTPYAMLVGLTEDGKSLLETEDQVHQGQMLPGDTVTLERTRADGYQLELRRTPMPDGGFVLTVTDNTKRAQAEGVLREAQKMQAIGQLTGGIAHDFNNLLTVILGNLDFARGMLVDQAMLWRYIERATWAAERGATLTKQLLAFARKQPLEPAPVDLSSVMPNLVPLLRRTLGEHIDVRYIEAAGLWPAMADAAQLENVVLNLALNARDAMPGGGRLTIELANKALDDEYARHHTEVMAGDYAMLAMSDNGCGMTPEVVSRVFEPFFTTKPEGKGTGLGLAMVFGFVKQSGGHVKVYSEPSEGTTVRLYLPRAMTLAPAAAARTSAPVDLPRGSATVLVVEDEPGVREIAGAILGDLGYRVLEAGDGEEGLRVFGAHTAAIDLLLTDIVLPGALRGRQMAERIVSIRPEVKVLYMSGYTENSVVHQGRLDDGVQLIGKPFKREELARKVAEVLGATSHPVGPSNVIGFSPMLNP